MADGKPKPTFFVAVALVVLGLVVFALNNAETIAPEGKEAGRIADILALKCTLKATSQAPWQRQ